MPAKKAGAKAAKKTGAKTAKTGAKAAKKVPAKGGGYRATKYKCPNSPAPFFTDVDVFAEGMLQWATGNNEIENCFLHGGCGGQHRIDELHDLCAEFAVWARHAKKWADEVESCWRHNCRRSGPPNHTQPPNPPF
jgi:hypothetical protein